MGKVTAQQFWHDQRFMSMIYIRYLQRKYHSDVYPIFQSWTYRLVSQLGDNAPIIFTCFVHLLILVNLFRGFILLCCDRRR